MAAIKKIEKVRKVINDERWDFDVSPTKQVLEQIANDIKNSKDGHSNSLYYTQLEIYEWEGTPVLRGTITRDYEDLDNLYKIKIEGTYGNAKTTLTIEQGKQGAFAAVQGNIDDIFWIVYRNLFSGTEQKTS